MIRRTYAVIDGDTLENNVKEIKRKYPNYEYYIGVVKNNGYHHGIKSVLDLIRGGINYLAVSSLEEALEIRNYQRDIPILCLEPISIEAIDDVLNNNITITIESLEYLNQLLKLSYYTDLKIHLKVDSGMHRLGFTDSKSFEEAVKEIQNHPNMILEGVYSHFATSGIMDPYWDSQVEKFLEITKGINLKSIPIVHFGRSITLVEHPKLDFCNGVRLGIILYGFSNSIKDGKGVRSKLRILKRNYLQKKYGCSTTTLENDLKVSPAFSLYSEILSIRKVTKDDVVGYNTYKIKEDGYIYTIPIGYADGVTKAFGDVVIESERYPIVSDCMDMIMVFGNKKFSVGTTVEIFGKEKSIKEVCKSTNQNAYHLLNQIQNRVIRIHKTGKNKEEIIY